MLMAESKCSEADVLLSDGADVSDSSADESSSSCTSECSSSVSSTSVIKRSKSKPKVYSSMFAVAWDEQICRTCEDIGQDMDFILCSKCTDPYHANCIPRLGKSMAARSNWLCAVCESNNGTPWCFVCHAGQDAGELYECPHPHCSKRYHRRCLQPLKQFCVPCDAKGTILSEFYSYECSYYATSNTLYDQATRYLSIETCIDDVMEKMSETVETSMADTNTVDQLFDQFTEPDYSLDLDFNPDDVDIEQLSEFLIYDVTDEACHQTKSSPDVISGDKSKPVAAAISILDNDLFLCPSHSCSTCMSQGKRAIAVQDKHITCIRCPISFHPCDDCVPAGTQVPSKQGVICPEHFIPKDQHAQHLTVNWCFECSQGVLQKNGQEVRDLICCDKCPAVYHLQCLKLDKPPEGDFLCSDCTMGKRLMYGDIIWSKLGVYRWWPAKILHPRDIPRNLENRNLEPGEFFVRYFGTGDYYWMNKGRVFAWADGDSAANGGGTSTLARGFVKGCKEAEKMYAETKLAMAAKSQLQEFNHVRKFQPTYSKIKNNVPYGNAQVYTKMNKEDVEYYSACSCKPEDRCGDSCHNRLCSIECHPAVCTAGAECRNRVIQRRQSPGMKPFATKDGRGWGLMAMDDIKKGQFVVEYVGEILENSELKRRLRSKNVARSNQFYFMTLDSARVIDAEKKGNLSRFMNNSCDPNCETQTWQVLADQRVGIFAIRDISKGEELTFNYRLDSLDTNSKMTCKCNSKTCIGVIANSETPKRRPKSVSQSVPSKSKNGRAHKKSVVVACTECQTRGPLKRCDENGCSRMFCDNCVSNLSDSIRLVGPWRCPAHQCRECSSQEASVTCQWGSCSTSFCPDHAVNRIAWIEDVGAKKSLVCAKHEEIFEKGDLCDSMEKLVGYERIAARKRKMMSTADSQGNSDPEPAVKRLRKGPSARDDESVKLRVSKAKLAVQARSLKKHKMTSSASALTMQIKTEIDIDFNEIDTKEDDDSRYPVMALTSCRKFSPGKLNLTPANALSQLQVDLPLETFDSEFGKCEAFSDFQPTKEELPTFGI